MNETARDSSPEPVPREIRSLLRGLRWRIRAYVWLQGISLAIAWLALTFWIGLALDYLPVLAGVGEMPRGARLVLLLVVGTTLAWILYRYVLQRTFARLADRHMAMLLERRHRQLADGLITAVELGSRAEPGSEHSRQMLATTRAQAVEAIRDVRLASVFNFRPLALSMTSAIVLAGTVGLFYAVNASAWELGFNRLYLLRSETWPRQARIEIVGVDLQEPGAAEGAGDVIPFREKALKVAKGSSMALVVRADASQKTVPEVCVVHYRTAEGERGRVNMTRIGRIRENFQLFRYEGKPFDGILSDLEFDAVGYDHRVSGYRLEVVDSPTLVAVEVACEFPEYMVNEQLSLWQPRTVPLTPGLQLPRGTKLKLLATANKPLQSVTISNPDGDSVETLSPGAIAGPAFEFPVAQLGEHLTLDIQLTDTDEVRSERPYRVHISGVEDTPPVIDMRLRGIGAAVTPDVLVPAVGKIVDDYGVARAWLEASLNESEPQTFALAPSAGGDTNLAVDFRTERARTDGMALQPGAKLHLTVKAVDRRDLGDGPNQASGDHYQLDVVTAEQLLTLLEARELGLRRRFEQILSELTETRDMLVRVRAEGPAQVEAPLDPAESPDGEEPAGDPGTDPEAGTKSPNDGLQRSWSLRLLRARQSLLQSQKSAQEVLGIAAGFHEIYEELVNNRVDTEDRKSRLREQVALPLEKIAQERFPAFDQQLEQLAAQVAAVEASGKLQTEDPTTVAHAQASVEQVNQILTELDAVLQRMLDLESFNELLDIVRSLIDEQERLSGETKKEQKKSVLELLK